MSASILEETSSSTVICLHSCNLAVKMQSHLLHVQSEEQNILNEYLMLSSLRHPNILSVGEYFDGCHLDQSMRNLASGLLYEQGLAQTEENLRQVNIFTMELAQTDLRSHIANHNKQPINPEKYRQIFRDIAKAANFLHQQGVCHNDIKMENILLFKSGEAKLSDFGLASETKQGVGIQKWQNREPSLVAPEVHEEIQQSFTSSPLSAGKMYAEEDPIRQVDLRKVDVFAFGVTLFESIFRMLPFHTEYACKTDKFYRHFVAGEPMNFWRIPIIVQLLSIYKRRFPEEFRPEELVDLLTKLLAYAPEDRINFADVLAHPWIKTIIGDNTSDEGEESLEVESD